MANVSFKGSEYTLLENESVLDCLLRNGHKLPFACRSGICQSCMLAIEQRAGQAAAEAESAEGVWQQGLTQSHRQLNYLLPCKSHPVGDISVREIDDAGNQVAATVVAKRWLSDSVIQLILSAELDYRAGQFVTLWRHARCARSYSLASLPGEDNHLEFHIRHIAEGEFSSWLANCIHKGDKIMLRGAMGTFFYSSPAEQPLVMCAVGTGLAPVLGVLRTALSQGHTGSIDLLVAARYSGDFYLLDELARISDAHANVNIHWLAQSLQRRAFSKVRGDKMLKANIYQYCREMFADSAAYHYYLCGAESFVKKMRKQLFISGVDLPNIKSDAFIAFA